MPETGGPATQDGVYFQNTVAALRLARLLSDQVHQIPHLDKVCEVRIEAPSEVDDILVTYESGRRDFIQAKLSLRRGTREWEVLWSHFRAQAHSETFDPRRDRLILAVQFYDELAQNLSTLVTIANPAHCPTFAEFVSRLTGAPRNLLEDIAGRICQAERDVYVLLQSVSVSIEGTPEQMERTTASRELSLVAEPLPGAFALLRDLTGGSARARGIWTFSRLVDALRQRGCEVTASQGPAYLLSDPVALERLEPIPPTNGFVGRESDIRRYKSELSNHRLAIIEGMPGAGKTWIGARVAMESGIPVFWMRFLPRISDNFQAFLRRVAKFLVRSGDCRLAQLLVSERQSGHPFPDSTKLDLLIETVSRLSCLLCFDDWHLVDQDGLVTSAVSALFRPSDCGAPNAAVLIMSRRRPTFATFLPYETLTGMTEIEATALLEQAGLALPTVLLKSLQQRTSGNPQFMSFFAEWHKNTRPSEHAAARFIDRMPTTDAIRRYLLMNIYEALTDADRKILQALSVFREPVPREAIEVLFEPGDVQLRLWSLVDRHVVESTRTEPAHYSLHPLVHDFCHEVLDPLNRKTLHRAAAEYCHHRLQYLEATHHYFEAGEFSTGADTILSHQETVIDAGLAVMVLRELESQIPSAFSQPTWTSLILLRAEVNGILGRYVEALRLYNDTLPGSPDEARADIWRKIGHIHTLKTEYQEALHSLSRAKVAAAGRDTIMSARIDIDLGYVLYRRREYADAEQHCLAALKVLEGTVHERDLANGHNNLANVYYELGEWPTAINHYLVAAEIRERKGDARGVARCLDNIGNIYLFPGEIGQDSAAMQVCQTGSLYGM